METWDARLLASLGPASTTRRPAKSRAARLPVKVGTKRLSMVFTSALGRWNPLTSAPQSPSPRGDHESARLRNRTSSAREIPVIPDRGGSLGHRRSHQRLEAGSPALSVNPLRRQRRVQ